jgi:hypothetical protein
MQAGGLWQANPIQEVLPMSTNKSGKSDKIEDFEPHLPVHMTHHNDDMMVVIMTTITTHLSPE